MNLGALVASLLTFGQQDLPTPEQYFLQHQKPPIYAQALESLSTSLLREADELAKKNTVAAIPIYKRALAESESFEQKEQAIGKLYDIYYKLVIEGHYNKWMIESARNFFNEVIEKHSASKYLPKAYHASGLILTIYDLKDITEGIRRMKEAYRLAHLSEDLQTQINVSWHIGRIGFEYVKRNEKEVSLKDVKFYLRKVIKLAPGSIQAKAAEQFLKELGLRKTK